MVSTSSTDVHSAKPKPAVEEASRDPAALPGSGTSSGVRTTRSSCSAWGGPRDPLPPPTPRLPVSDILTIGG